jgi:hypothetical protein
VDTTSRWIIKEIAAIARTAITIATRSHAGESVPVEERVQLQRRKIALLEAINRRTPDETARWRPNANSTSSAAAPAGRVGTRPCGDQRPRPAAPIAHAPRGDLPLPSSAAGSRRGGTPQLPRRARARARAESGVGVAGRLRTARLDHADRPSAPARLQRIRGAGRRAGGPRPNRQPARPVPGPDQRADPGHRRQCRRIHRKVRPTRRNPGRQVPQLADHTDLPQGRVAVRPVGATSCYWQAPIPCWSRGPWTSSP